jgi:hypothetical protein
MADKKISDFTALTSLATGDLLEVETVAGNSRKATADNVAKSLRGMGMDGAKVRKAAGLTAQNLTGTASVTWDSEDWDTGSYHDNGSNTERLTTANAGYYQVIGHLQLANVASGNWVQLAIERLNSSGVLQENIALLTVELTATISYFLNVVGTALFASGDYARLRVQVESDTSVDIQTNSYLEIRRVG